jgi:PAS domain S-box-containing protein
MAIHQSLRDRAESMLSKDHEPELSIDDVRELAHELAVHQIELEVQNEELRNAQVAIAESRDNYQDLYDFSPVAYLTLDKNGIVIEANLTAASLFDMDRIRLLGKHVSTLCQRQSGNLMKGLPIAFDEESTSEAYLKRQDGSCFYGQIKSRRSVNRTSNEPQQRLAIIDITEKKASEKTIHDLAKFPDENSNPVLRIRRNGEILYANSASTCLLNEWNAGVGQTIASDLLAEITTLSEKGTPHNKIIQCNDRAFSLAITPINGQDYINIYGHDITFQQELEKQVRQKVKMEVIGQLAGGIAHDFNNILAVIVGFASLAQDDVDKGSILEDYINNILTASDRAKHLVNRILSFSRQSHDSLTPMSLPLMLKEIETFLRASLPTSIDIKCSLHPNTPPVNADSIRIHEVVMNLCTNSAHAMSEKGTLEIACYGKEITQAMETPTGTLEPGFYSVISVEDSGSGMTPEIVSHIFEPFYTTKDVGMGTGMGMAVVFGIIQSHKGYLTVNSTPGEGTLIRIFLPTTDETSFESHTETNVIPGGTERILFVDDEPAIAGVATTILRKLGYTLSTHTSSLEALAVFRDDPNAFDLVISDQTMPEMTGIELAGELLGLRPNLSIILCTGYSNTIDEKKALEAGIKGFCLKPLCRRDLAAKIRDVLDA